MLAIREHFWRFFAAAFVTAFLGTGLSCMVSEGMTGSVAQAAPGSSECRRIASDMAEQLERILQREAEIRAAEIHRGAWRREIDQLLAALAALVDPTAAQIDAAAGPINALIDERVVAIGFENLARTEIQVSQIRLQMLLEAWAAAECGPEPEEICQAAGVRPPTPATSTSRALSPAARRAAPDNQRMLNDLTHPVGAPRFGYFRADGTITPIGSESGPAMLDPRTNLPIVLNPEQTTFRQNEIVRVQDINIAQPGEPIIPVVQVTGDHGQTGIRGNPGGVLDSFSDLASYMGSMFVLPTFSSVSNSFGRAVPLIVTVGTGAALLWRATRFVGPRAFVPLNALFMAIDRIHEMEEAAQRPPLEARNRSPQCGFHVVLTVRSQAQPVRMSSKVSKSDAAPPASEPAPTATPPGLPEGPDQDLSSGGGDSVVSYAGSTCGRVKGVWTWRIFSGLVESGRGASALITGKPGITRGRQVSNVISYNNLLDKSEVDWSRRETRDIWDAYVPRLRDQIKASLSGITTQLSDSDRIGSGRPTFMIFKHPQARRFRVQIRPGCDVTPPEHYLARDAS